MNTHELLELIRHLEKQDKLDAALIKSATENAKQQEGSAFDKLVARAYLIDNSGELQTALNQVYRSFKAIGTLWMVSYFVLGMVSGWALLSLSVLNFFYVWLVLLGWHSLSLLWWLIRPKQSHWLHTASEYILNRQLNKPTLFAQAAKIVLTSRQNVWQWQLARLLHQGWLAWLMGNFVALLGLFLFKEYQFVWQSTLLNQQHFATLVAIIAYVPHILGINVPSYTTVINNTATASDFAQLILSSLVLYALLPRFLCWLACYHLGQNQFKVDTQLYYYENLMRQLTIYNISPDDYQPAAAKPVQAVIPSGNKVVATLEIPAKDSFWYQFGAGHAIDDLGVVDSKEDMQRLIHHLQSKSALLYLGIDTTIVPDRGVVRKLYYIAKFANSGIVVQLLGNHSHKAAWQQVLIAHHIAEARFD